jgi:hypothetical protein
MRGPTRIFRADLTPCSLKLREWTASWVEQRLYPEYALSALTAPGASASSKALAARISGEMARQWPVAAPSLAGFSRVPPGAAIRTPHFVAKVSPTTGGITSLVPTAAAAAPVGLYPIVASQYSSTALYQDSYHIK